MFEAFADPAITSQFWFTRGSGRLEPGARVRWHWDMYGVASDAVVTAFEKDRHITIDWLSDTAQTSVDWRFSARADGTTFVDIVQSGFAGDADAIAAQALASTEGFTLVLAGLKALLEHGVRLNLVADRFPDGAGRD
ncbi:MAG: SRPBCC domain-containing protein [Luteimonas sp.]